MTVLAPVTRHQGCDRSCRMSDSFVPSPHLVVACAWCREVLSPECTDTSEHTAPVEVTHTICPICRAVYFRQLLTEPTGLSEQRPAACGSDKSSARRRASRRRSTRRALAGASLVATLAGVLVSCAGKQEPQGTWTMPNPDGCYARVWDQRAFRGASEFINGPRQYSDLRDLPGRHDWDKRIRSLQLGSRASVVAWSEEQLRGT